MRVLRILAVSLLFVFTGLGIVGGCGGGGGGGGGQPTAPPTTPPTTPPTAPPTAPPTEPPTACQVPPLNSNFSNLLYIFIDEPNNIIIGVTSDGETVAIAAADIIEDPLVIALGAIPVSADLALIDVALVEDLIFDASGDGVRLNNGSIFQVNDLIIGDVVFDFDMEGECDSVEPLNASSSNTLRGLAGDLSQTRGLDTGSGIITDYAIDVLNNGE